MAEFLMLAPDRHGVRSLVNLDTITRVRVEQREGAVTELRVWFIGSDDHVSFLAAEAGPLMDKLGLDRVAPAAPAPAPAEQTMADLLSDDEGK